jgi:hypothetical protein
VLCFALTRVLPGTIATARKPRADGAHRKVPVLPLILAA